MSSAGRLSRTLAPFVLALAPSPSLCAQEPDPDPDPSIQLERALVERLLPEVSSRLKSERPRTIAWGGWLAGEYHLEEARDLLRDALRRLAVLPYEDRKFAVLAVLDGLVQSGVGDVPAEELVPHLRGVTHYPALVLLARQPARSAGPLLDLYRGEEEGTRLIWQACGNLLVEHAPQQFALELLGGLGVELRITVSDSDRFSGSGSGRLGGAAQDGRLQVPDGYPPTVIYELSDRGRAGEVVLAGGVRPVYFLRKVLRGRRIGFGSMRTTVDRMPIRFEWLAALLDTRADRLDLAPVMRAGIDVRQVEFLPAAVAARQRVLDAYAGIVTELREKGLLARSGAAVAPLEVEVKVRDAREDKGEPLPPLPPVEPGGRKGTS